MLRITSLPVAITALALAACQPPTPNAELPTWTEVTADVRASVPAADPTLDRHPRLRDAVRGDFNGDGQRDKFALMTQPEGGRVALYFFDGAGAAPVEMIDAGHRGDLPEIGLLMLPKGSAHEICMIYAMQGELACEAEKAFDTPVLVYAKRGESARVIVWNGDKFETWEVSEDRSVHLLAVS